MLTLLYFTLLHALEG